MVEHVQCLKASEQGPDVPAEFLDTREGKLPRLPLPLGKLKAVQDWHAHLDLNFRALCG